MDAVLKLKKCKVMDSQEIFLTFFKGFHRNLIIIVSLFVSRHKWLVCGFFSIKRYSVGGMEDECDNKNPPFKFISRLAYFSLLNAFCY